MTRFIGPAVTGADISPRSVSVGSPYANKLLGDTTLTTPSGIVAGQVWDFGGVGHHAGQFGCKFDGVTDDTTAMQKFADFITNNTGLLSVGFGSKGLLPPGISIISTGAINFSSRPGWSLIGAGKYASVIRQSTNNVGIFVLGSDSASSLHSWAIEDLAFDYSNVQGSGNTAALPIVFDGGASDVFHGRMKGINFLRGAYAMSVAAGRRVPWGNVYDDIHFSGGLSIGAYDNSGSAASACPNNHWGRISVDMGGTAGMVGPVFNQIRGYNFVIDTLEFYDGPGTNAQLLIMAAGCELVIGALKLECSAGAYTASQTLINVQTVGRLQIEHVFLGGGQFGVTGAFTLTAFSVTGKLVLGMLDISGTLTLSGGGLGYVFTGGGNITVGNFGAITSAGFPVGTGWSLTNAASSSTQDNLTVLDWVRGALTQNKGDASYAIALGDPNIIAFETAFTAQRTITLPGTDANLGNLPNGLRYRIRFKGAINGANTALIVCNAVTLLTQATDLVIVEFTYRRTTLHPQNGWVLTAYETAIPA